MKFSAQELSDMVSKRQFGYVVAAYHLGEVDEDDGHAVYQVFVAATMIRDLTTADRAFEVLPRELHYDASRDILLMQIRTRTLEFADAFERADQLVEQASDLNRQAIAHMAYARLCRAVGGQDRMATAQREIHEAFRLMVVQEQPDPVWRRNVAFWYLVIGTAGMRTEALNFVLEDPSRQRRMFARLCYCLEVGRLLPIY